MLIGEVGSPVLKPNGQKKHVRARLSWEQSDNNLKRTRIPMLNRSMIGKCNSTKAAHNTSKYMQCAGYSYGPLPIASYKYL